ncbi:MAG TPA: hypothetical protein VFZ67_12165 [Nitrososphaera sp.]
MNMGTVPKTGSTAGRGLAPSSILAFIAGALMIAGVIVGALTFTLWSDNGMMMTSPGMMDGGMMGGGMMGGGMMSDSFMWAAIWGVAAIWVGTGAVSIVGGYAIYRNPQSTTIWGIAILIASIVGLLTVGGFIIGPILGIVAGILALVRK